MTKLLVHNDDRQYWTKICEQPGGPDKTLCPFDDTYVDEYHN